MSRHVLLTMTSALALAPCAALALPACTFDPQGTGERSASPVDGGVLDAAPPPDGAPDAAPFCDPADPTLVGCYRFEDVEDPLRDDSAAANDGEADEVTSVAGPPGHGLALALTDKSKTHVDDDPSLDATTQLTLELWVHPDALPPMGGRAGLVDNNGEYGLFLAPDGKIRCSMGATTAIGLGIEAGRWTHLACSYDGTVISMYQDGFLRDQTTTSVTLGTGGSDGLAIGTNSPDGDVLVGAVDDVRIFIGVRSAHDVCVAAGVVGCP